MESHDESKEPTLKFSSDAESLVTIKPDGTVTIHKDGADKQAAKAFWGSMGDELKNIEKALIWERNQWRDKYEELKTIALELVKTTLTQKPIETEASRFVGGDTGIYIEEDGSEHFVFKGKKIF